MSGSRPTPGPQPATYRSRDTHENDEAPPSYEEAVQSRPPRIPASGNYHLRPQSQPAPGNAKPARLNSRMYPGNSGPSRTHPPAPLAARPGQPAYQAHVPPPAPNFIPGQPPGLHLNYPPNYFCWKCNNTGIKGNGSPCGQCQALFAVQRQPVHYLPPGFIPPNARPVQPGDPSLGGVLCKVCMGDGYTEGLFSTSQCYRCRGIGRLL